MNEDSEKYTLVGVDSNLLSVVAYTQKAMRAEGFTDKEQKEMQSQAFKCDYYKAVGVCLEYIDLCNERAKEKDLER